jgi:signal transduction histidine kinase
MPADLLATVVLSASSVLLGFFLPLGAGLAIVGVVRGFVLLTWKTFVAGLLMTVGLVAAGVFLRAWGATLAVDVGAANQTAGVVFTAVTPVGVILGVVFVVAALVRLVADRRASRPRPR